MAESGGEITATIEFSRTSIKDRVRGGFSKFTATVRRTPTSIVIPTNIKHEEAARIDTVREELSDITDKPSPEGIEHTIVTHDAGAKDGLSLQKSSPTITNEQVTHDPNTSIEEADETAEVARRIVQGGFEADRKQQEEVDPIKQKIQENFTQGKIAELLEIEDNPDAQLSVIYSSYEYIQTFQLQKYDKPSRVTKD